MALTEIELKRCEKALAAFMKRRRPPVRLRDQLDICYRISGQSIDIFESRPDWRDRSKKSETPVARLTFVRTRNNWKLFWMRRDLKWHAYNSDIEANTLEAFLKVVDEDAFACFFG